jgi:hypothetical protein
MAVAAGATDSTRPLCDIQPPSTHACNRSFTTCARLNGCRAKADAGIFPMITRWACQLASNNDGESVYIRYKITVKNI